MQGCRATVCIEQVKRAAGAGVGVEVCVVVVRLGFEGRCTFASTLNLTAAKQGVIEEIR